MARRVAVRVSDRIISEVITTGKNNDGFVVETGMPDGAVLVMVGLDPTRGEVVLTFEHESFGDIQEGYHYPEVRVQLRRIDYRGQAEWLMGQLEELDPNWKEAPGARHHCPDAFDDEDEHEHEDWETKLKRLSARLREQ